MIPVLRTLMLAACAMLFQTAHAACENHFFAPDDNGNARPLNRPHAEFAAVLRAANGGNATAARGGDQEAKRWMEAHEALLRMAAGPECVGAYCSGNADGRGHVAMFYAGRHGHYFAPLTINGITVDGLIDTGASSIAMSTETARKLGIDKLPGKSGSVQTANGLLTAEHVVVPEVTISGITLHDVRVAIGTTGETLIGMSFLGRLQLRMGGGVLSMSR